MRESIVIEGQHYISSRRAAEMTRYANDYIGQLCRSRKIDGRMIGRVWYVNRESILAYQKASDANYHQNNELPPVEHVMPIVPVASVPTPVEGVATIIPIAAPVAPIVAPSGMTYGADTRPLLPELIKGSIEEVPAAPIVEIQKKNIFGSSIAQAKTIASGTGARLFATLFVSLLVGYSAAFALSNYQPAVSAYGNISDAVASYTSKTQSASAIDAIGSWWREISGTLRISVLAFLGFGGQPASQAPANNVIPATIAVPQAPAIVINKSTTTIAVNQAPAVSRAATTTIIERIVEKPGQTTIINQPYSDQALVDRVSALETNLSDFISLQTLQNYALGDQIGRNISAALSGFSGGGGGTGSVTSVDVNGGTTGLSFAGGPITSSGSLTLGGTLSAANGGTGISSYGTGDILYGNSLGGLSTLAAAANGLVLKLVGGVPVWQPDLSGSGGAGAWATSTDNLSVYPAMSSNVVIIGGTATTTTGNILEVIGNTKLGGNLTLGSLTGLLYGTNGAVGTIATNTLNINSDNIVQGVSNLFYNNALVNAFIHASTTIAKTYTNNTWNGSQAFNGGASIGSLNGVLFGTNGAVGTIATSSFNLSIPLASTTGILAVNQGGTGTSTFGQGWIYSNGGTGALAASTSPTLAYITATSTTATSTFAGGVAGPNNFVIQQGSGFVGIGTTSPYSTLAISAGVPAISINSSNTGQTFQIRTGVNNSSQLSFFDAVTGKTMLAIQGGDNGVLIGTTTNPNTNSRLFVNGGSNGANVDARGTPGVNDQSTFEAEGSDYDTNIDSTRIQFLGPGAVGTTYGLPNANLGRLAFSNSGNALISVDGTTTPLYFAANNNIHMTLLSTNGNLGLGTTSPSAQLSIAGASGGTSPIFSVSTSTSGFSTTTAIQVDQNGNLSLLNGAGLTLGSLTGVLLGTNGAVSAVSTSSLNISTNLALASGVLGVPNGGTGWGAFTANDLIFGNGTGALATSSNLSFTGGTTLNTNTLSATTICFTGDTCRTTWPTGGGSSVAGPWSTTTSSVLGELVNYSNNNSFIVAIGGTSTTTAPFWFDPNTLSAYMNGSLTVTGTSTVGGLALTAGSTISQGGSTILDSSGNIDAVILPLQDTAAALASVIPQSGQMVYETDTKYSKVGDGVTNVGSLVPVNPWLGYGTNSIYYSAGDVGIGTTTQSRNLNIYGDVNVAAGQYYRYNGVAMASASTTLGNYFFAGAGNLTATGAGANYGIGVGALGSLLSGNGNVAIGQSALAADTIGSGNIAIKGLALNTSGGTNISFDSMSQNTTGGSNIGIGHASLNANITGSDNTALGVRAMDNNFTGSSNVSVGEFSLHNNTSATNTVAVGYESGFGHATYYNQGGTYLGYKSGFSLDNGSDYNTLLGYQAGFSLTKGTYNVAIGQNVNLASSTGSQQLNIGNVLYGTGLYNGASVSSAPVIGNIGIGTTSPFARLSVAGAGADTSPLFALSTSTAAFATTTALMVDQNGNLSLLGGAGLTINALTGVLLGTSGAVSAVSTSSLNINFANLVGFSTVAQGGTGQTSFGQGWLNSDGTTITSSTSPTVAYITATSTTATSTFSTALFVATSTADDVLAVQAKGGTNPFEVYNNVGTSIFLVNSNGMIGINKASPTSVVDILGLTPATVSGGGTTATKILNVVAGNGGATSGSAAVGGIGGAISLSTGSGSSGGSSSGNGGAGGSMAFLTGGGGGGQSNGGSGGNVTWNLGSGGGALSGGGVGGSFSINAGGGGTPSAGTAATGGAINLTAGTGGGNGSSLNGGLGGAVTITGGAGGGGGGPGNLGNGSYVAIVGGAGGGGSGTSGSGGNVYIYGGFASNGGTSNQGNVLLAMNTSNQVMSQYVGIGTSTPARHLDIANSDGLSQILLEDTTAAAGFHGIGIKAKSGDFSINSMTDAQVSTTRLLIASTTGNVGIGTTTPGSLFAIGNTNGINFSTASTTFSSTGGINLANGCFAINNNCLSLNNLGGSISVANGGTGASTFGQGWIYSNGGTGALAASTSPTVAYITATSTTATNLFGSTVGIATSSPWALLSVNPNGIAGPAFVVGSSTATNLIVDNAGRVGVGTTSVSSSLNPALAVSGLNASSGNTAGQVGLAAFGGNGFGSGAGGAIDLFGGNGSNNSSSNAGPGGALNFVSGNGGNYTGASTNNPGAGGTISFVTGTAGTNTNACCTTAAGGAFSVTTGAGGANSGGPTGSGGNGGAVTFNLGAGGAAASASTGFGGAFSVVGGLGGGSSGTQAAGVGSAISLTSGTGGDNSSTGKGGAGGAVTITAGDGGFSGSNTGGAGGGISLSAGSGGASNGAGGNITLNGGAPDGTGKTGNILLATLRGNVGIGTTSPYANLSVAGSSGGTNPIFVISTSTSAFSTSTAFIVSNTGYVGIGNNASPAYNLDINGANTTIGNSFSGGNMNMIGTGNFRALFTASSDEGLCIGSIVGPCAGTGGSVAMIDGEGLGIKLQSNDIITLTSNNTLTLDTQGDGDINLITSGQSVNVGDSVDAGHTFLTVDDSNDSFRFNNGNVGIATSSPGTLFAVAGSAYIGGNLTATGTLSVLGALDDSFSSNGTAGYVLMSTAAGVKWVASTTLTNISGTLNVANGGTGASTFGQGWIYSNGGTGALSASTSPTVAYITATSTTGINFFGGSVGIATSSPGALFAVAGNSLFGTGASSFVSWNVGTFANSQSSTTTIPTNSNFAWTIATSTTAVPIFQIDTTGSVSTTTIGGAGGGNVTIGDSSSPTNLVFGANASVLTNGKVLTFGQAGDAFNFAVNLGIGTSTPFSALTVASGNASAFNGALCADNGGLTKCYGTLTAGVVYGDSSSFAATDLAENYSAADDSIGAGDIVMTASSLSQDQTDKRTNDKAMLKQKGGQSSSIIEALNAPVSKADGSASILGVISTNPGVLLGDATGFKLQTKLVPVALSGRVPVKVNGEGGPISAGDRIALSSIPGIGAKATSTGPTIGIALENWYASSTVGTINVFISAGQYYNNPALAGVAQSPSASTTISSYVVTPPADNSPAITVQTSVDDISLILSSSTVLDEIASSTAPQVASITADILASSTPSFISRVASAVTESIQSAAGWVFAKITATLAIFTRVETQTAAISNGLEMTDSATRAVYCVRITNGDWEKTPGTCPDIATTTASTASTTEVANPVQPLVPPIIQINAPASTTTVQTASTTTQTASTTQVLQTVSTSTQTVVATSSPSDTQTDPTTTTVATTTTTTTITPAPADNSSPAQSPVTTSTADQSAPAPAPSGDTPPAAATQ